MFKDYIKEKYHFSSYQIAQLTFLFKTVVSEISKVLLMSLLFHNRLSHYFFALLIMLCLRCSTGGMHFYTYWSCLTASALYLWISVVLLPKLTFPPAISLLLLAFSMLLCYFAGPVTSKYRPPMPPDKQLKSKHATCAFIFLFALIQYIIPDNPYCKIGFWVIILHSLQLLIAKNVNERRMKNG